MRSLLRRCLDRGCDLGLRYLAADQLLDDGGCRFLGDRADVGKRLGLDIGDAGFRRGNLVVQAGFDRGAVGGSL